MPKQELPDEIVRRAVDHLNEDHRPHLLAYARALGGAAWAETATVTRIDSAGFDLLVTGEGDRRETLTIAFPEMIADAARLRRAFVDLAVQAMPSAATPRTATATVPTPHAMRYLKALCNHFDRKAEAGYEGRTGVARFPFGECSLAAEEYALLIRVTAANEIDFEQVKNVVADHLVRFGAAEAVIWTDVQQESAAAP